MIYLLYVNVLVALIDPAHISHNAAHAWFATHATAWASCPITENGVIRIHGHPKYPNSSGSPAAIAPILATLRALPGHHFWPDSISLIGRDIIDATQITTPGQVTDVYLLALAITHDGQLATFDRRLATEPVRRGKSGLHIFGNPG